MYSERAWHWWFPVYEHSFAKYSPGALLLLGVAEEAAARGIALLDLGKGDDAYKSSFSNTDTPLAEGCASRRSLGAALRWGRENGRSVPYHSASRCALLCADSGNGNDSAAMAESCLGFGAKRLPFFSD